MESSNIITLTFNCPDSIRSRLYMLHQLFDCTTNYRMTHVGIRLADGNALEAQMGKTVIGYKLDTPHDYELILPTPYSDRELAARAVRYQSIYGAMDIFNFREVNCLTFVKFVLDLPPHIANVSELYDYAANFTIDLLCLADTNRGIRTTPRSITFTGFDL